MSSDERQKLNIGAGGIDQLFAQVHLVIRGATVLIHELDTTEAKTSAINLINKSNSFEVDISTTTDTK